MEGRAGGVGLDASSGVIRDQPMLMTLARADAQPRAFLGVERSLTGRRWVSRLDEHEARYAVTIAQRHALPDIVARVLAARGVAPDRACDVAVARPITDDPDMQRSIMEVVKAIF